MSSSNAAISLSSVPSGLYSDLLGLMLSQRWNLLAKSTAWPVTHVRKNAKYSSPSTPPPTQLDTVCDMLWSFSIEPAQGTGAKIRSKTQLVAALFLLDAPRDISSSKKTVSKLVDFIACALGMPHERRHEPSGRGSSTKMRTTVTKVSTKTGERIRSKHSLSPRLTKSMTTSKTVTMNGMAAYTTARLSMSVGCEGYVKSDPGKPILAPCGHCPSPLLHSGAQTITALHLWPCSSTMV
eukprot:5440935-Amphidinium_carterae.2